MRIIVIIKFTAHKNIWKKIDRINNAYHHEQSTLYFFPADWLLMMLYHFNYAPLVCCRRRSQAVWCSFTGNRHPRLPEPSNLPRCHSLLAMCRIWEPGKVPYSSGPSLLLHENPNISKNKLLSVFA